MLDIEQKVLYSSNRYLSHRLIFKLQLTNKKRILIFTIGFIEIRAENNILRLSKSSDIQGELKMKRKSLITWINNNFWWLQKNLNTRRRELLNNYQTGRLFSKTSFLLFFFVPAIFLTIILLIFFESASAQVSSWTPVQISLPSYMSEKIINHAVPSNGDLHRSTIESVEWTTIFSDGFEGDFPGNWITYDEDGISTSECHWGKRNCRPYFDDFSAWAVGGGADGSNLNCGDHYPNDANSWMIYGPFSLEGATYAEFSFNYWLNSELDYDYFSVLASINGSNFFGIQISGQEAEWRDHVFDLTNVYSIGDLTGQPQVWIGFLFTSDNTTTCEAGVYVDDVVIRASASQTFTISASAGANGSISPSGDVTVKKGEDQAFIITPDPGYQVGNVDVDGYPTDAVTQYTFTNVQSNHSIYALFDHSPVTYDLCFRSGDVAVIEDQTFNHTCLVIANVDHCNQEPHLNFHKASSANGSISPSGNVVIIEGEDQTFDITPDPGYQVANVNVDGSSVGAVTQYTFTNVQFDHTIHATFQSISHKVFLPLILHEIPLSPPGIPILNKIHNPDGKNSYTVSWETAVNAANYVLQEADNTNFTGGSTVYDGPNTSFNITGKGLGTYYYRVKAKNAAYESEWSNIESVKVTVEMPEPAEWKIIILPENGKFPSLALDSKGNPHIAYSRCFENDNYSASCYNEADPSRNPHSYGYLGWDGASWKSSFFTDLYCMNNNASLVIDHTDQPQIVYSRDHGLNSSYLGYSLWDGSLWNNTTTQIYPGIVYYVNLALQKNGDPCISYLRWSEIKHSTAYGIWQLHYGCNWSGKDWWNGYSVANLGFSYNFYGWDLKSYFHYHSLALTDDGIPHISWNGIWNDLNHATIVDGSWEITRVDQGKTGAYSSLALDSQNHPHISYHDRENGDLKYARWDGSNWQIETIDSSGIVGLYTSLALDKDGNPHISYIDETNGALKYAFWDGSQWIIATIDDSGNSWRWTSLALDDSGFVHISYVGGELKYATNSGFPGE
jgi:hypothetical protein